MIRNILIKILRLYTRYFPIRRGKERLINLIDKNNPPHKVELVNFHRDLRIELNLGEHIQRRIYYYGYIEYNTVKILMSKLKAGSIVADIGANIGQYTLIAAHEVQEFGEVHAFEPNAEVYAALERNVLLNGFTNVHLNHVAVANREEAEHVFFAPRSDNWGSGSLAKTTYKLSEAGYSVPVITLDQYFAERERKPELIKIDVEGAELLVLKGAQSLIETSKPIIITELSAENFAAFGYTIQDLTEYLVRHGYEISKILDNGRLAAIPADTTFCNAICVPVT